MEGDSSELARELDQLLTEPVAAAQKRSASAFRENIATSQNRVVLFGTGSVGRRALGCLRRDQIEVLAFADNDRSKWGGFIDGIEVVSPDTAVSRYGTDANFIVTIYNHSHAFPQTREQLRGLGAKRISSVIPLRWHYHDEFLPYYRDDLPHKVLLDGDAIRKAFSLWADGFSRQEFVAQVRWRLHGDFDGLSAPTCGDQYFPADVIRLSRDEFFVDVGAFDGDTVRALLTLQQSEFRRIVALEPDPQNFRKLSDYIASLPDETRTKIEAFQLAAGSANTQVMFDSTGSNAAAVSGQGSVTVDCVRLDDLLQGRTPTYIKLDIEGAEMEALAGAEAILREARPRVAACVYHRQDHLWKIPLQLKQLLRDCSLYLRSHMYECWETVCYALPGPA